MRFGHRGARGTGVWRALGNLFSQLSLLLIDVSATDIGFPGEVHTGRALRMRIRRLLRLSSDHHKECRRDTRTARELEAELAP